MAMEELGLPQSRAAALLASPSPLADVYKEFCRPGNFLHGCGAGTASSSGPRRRWMPSGNCRSTGTTPPMPREQGDLDLYRASRRANIACKGGHRGVHFGTLRDNRLDKDAAAPGD